MTAHPVEWTPEKIEKFWTMISSDPDLTQSYFTRDAGSAIIRLFRKNFRKPGARILDYGCGPGFLLEAIAKIGVDCKYTGIDFSAGSVNAVREKGKTIRQFESAIQIKTIDTDLQQQFDAIICCEVIEHLDNDFLAKMIQFFLRHLKPGGILLLTTPNSENLGKNSVYCPDCGAHFHRWQHLRSWNKDSLERYLVVKGLKECKFFEVEFHNSWLRQCLRQLFLRLRGKNGGNLVCIAKA